MGCGAPSASASPDTFLSESSPVTLHATQEASQVFTITGKSVVCKQATFHGTQAGTVAGSLTLHPEYKECKFGELEATVNVPAACNFVIDGSTDAKGEAPLSIECGHGEPITMSLGGVCTVKVGDTHPPSSTTVNQGLSGVTYTNIGAGTTREITINANLTGISAVVEGSLCFLGGISTGTHSDATYTGKATLTGTQDGGGSSHIGVFYGT